jgi:hypothetical protein
MDVANRPVGQIHVGLGSLVFRTPNRPDPCMQILALRAWLDQPERYVLRTDSGTLAGVVDLGSHRASIEIAPGERHPDLAREVFCSLTVAAALLLNRQDKFLLHAAAFVGPAGLAWLLVGDSQSGKSSTCANAIRLGWSFLADDQVVIGSGPDGSLQVEGWPRDFNLDEGFEAGTSTGTRSPTDPSRLGSGRWQRSAPLGGILFPVIRAARQTSLSPVSRADALQELVRQSPWLLADAKAAPMVLGRMQAMTTLPAFRLSLGTDAYQDPTALQAVLLPLVDSGGVMVD